MKKGIKVLLIILGVIIILGLIFFAVDYSRVQKQDFENEYNYENNDVSDTNEKEQEALEELPSDYPMEQAIKDGCVVISYNAVFNKSKLDSFIANTSANNENRQSDFMRIVQYTIEGDPIITDLEYREDLGYILTYDNTRDAFGADTKVTTYDDIPAEIYSIDLVEDENFINIELTLQGDIDYDSDSTKEYKPMTVASYPKETETYDTAPSFIGKVTEVNEKTLLVNSEDKNIGDAVWVDVEDTSQYAVGDKIEVFYTGIVLESYPCQIYEIDVRKIEE